MDCKFFHCDQREGEWCEKYPIPRCHNRGGCEYEEEALKKLPNYSFGKGFYELSFINWNGKEVLEFNELSENDMW